MRRAAILCLMLASPAWAEAPLSVEALDRLVTGRTLTYAQDGEIYGVERYLPGRRVIWAFTEDECRFGTYHAQGDEICFLYEGDPNQHCWTFHMQDGRLGARYAGDPEGTELSAVEDSAAGLPCPGPDVGA